MEKELYDLLKKHIGEKALSYLIDSLKDIEDKVPCGCEHGDECDRCNNKRKIDQNLIVILASMYDREDGAHNWLASSFGKNPTDNACGDNNHSPYCAIFDCCEHMLIQEWGAKK